MATDNHSIEHLLAVLETVRQHAPKDAADYFCDGVNKFMTVGGSLDRCLDLVPQQGSPHPAKAYLTWKRNHHLIAAHRHSKGASDWEKSKNLAERAKAFEISTWLDVKDQELPGTNWSDQKKELFYAYRCGLGIPDKRQIHDIVRRHTLSGRIDNFSLR